MKFEPSRISVKRPKRLVVIIISAIILAGLITYGVFSYLHWRDFDQNSQKAATSLKSTIESSLGSGKTTATPSDQIDTIVSDFEKDFGTNPCDVSSWYSWQTVLPMLGDMRSTCDQRFATALNVITTLKPLSQFLKDEKKADDLLTTTIKATKAPTDYKAASTTWKAVAKSAELSDTTEFNVVRTKITEVTTAISAAFTALANAVSGENKLAFDAATADLETAYDGIDALKTTADDERTTLIQVFITAYETL